MANPALNEKVLSQVREFSDTSRMTIEGTVNKTGFLLLFLVAGATFGWGSQSGILMISSLILSLIFSMIIIFSPTKAPYLSQAYAFCEGILLGSISAVYSMMYPGIVSNALMLTVSCLALMLGLYRFRIIRVTDRLRAVIVAATLAIFVTYLIEMLLSFFGGPQIPMIHQSSPVGILFSLVVVAIAAFNLLLDFDMIERAKAQGAPKFMEWYCGFSLLVTLVWLYLEILRLLSKMNKK